jgi:hypothetical protein
MLSWNMVPCSVLKVDREALTASIIGAIHRTSETSVCIHEITWRYTPENEPGSLVSIVSGYGLD